jgi:hypothetical protein
MITHLVLFRLKPGITADDVRVVRLQAEMGGLPHRIASIRQWEFGANTTADSQAWDFGLRAGFDTQEALFGYFEHPAHLPVLEQWNDIAELAFADFQT